MSEYIEVRADDTMIRTEREADGRWIAERLGVPGLVAYGESQKDAVEKLLWLASHSVAMPKDERVDALTREELLDRIEMMVAWDRKVPLERMAREVRTLIGWQLAIDQAKWGKGEANE